MQWRLSGRDQTSPLSVISPVQPGWSPGAVWADRMKVMARLRLLVLTACALLPSCTFVSENANVMVNSDPQGAEILLNGLPTGQTTPSMLYMEDEAATHATRRTSRKNRTGVNFNVSSFRYLRFPTERSKQRAGARAT